MLCFLIQILICLWLTAPSFLKAGETLDGAACLKIIQRRYEKVRYLRAKFIQISGASGVVSPETASGIVYLRKDGKLRWDYDKPDPVLIISDGQTLWIFQTADNQVMVDRHFKKKLKHFPYTFLKGMETLAKEFTARVLKYKRNDIILELFPKTPLQNISKLLLTFNKNTGIIQKVSWASPQGADTAIAFSDIDITSEIPDSVFRFEPPEGVDVIDAKAP
jgi:outer membrane lipoprotein carrier protein